MRAIRIMCPNEKCRLELVIHQGCQGQFVKCAGCGRKFLAPPAEPPRASKADRQRKVGKNSEELLGAAVPVVRDSGMGATSIA